MIFNIIIGKNSSISLACKKYLKNFEIISSNNLDYQKISKIRNKNNKVNLIFNNFYPSKLLNDLSVENYSKFNSLTLEKLTLFLENFPYKKINKIIYTSSSAVYSIQKNLNGQHEDKFNRELYAAYKLSAEKLITNFANKKKIKYYICRIFNTYGDDNDEFSFINKIVKCKIQNKKITIHNSGISLRDFIHVNDIGRIYNKILNHKVASGIYDIGTGLSYQIRDIVNFLEFREKNIIKKKNIFEINNSLANIEKLSDQIGTFKFIKLDNYLSKKIQLKLSNKLVPIFNHKIIQPNIPGSIIYGAGYAGKKMYNHLNSNNENILCFIDDNKKIQNTYFNGLPILSYENVLNNKKNFKVLRIFITIPSLSKKKLSLLLNKVKKDFLDVRYLPEKKFLNSDHIDLNDLKISEINNILNRKEIIFKKINYYKDKNILVTGAGGTIGSELCRQLITQGARKIIAIDNSELNLFKIKEKTLNKKIVYKLLNINNKKLLFDILVKFKINIIFHAAAYKHVNILEENIFSAVENNVFGTLNVCEAADKFNAKMVFISTDKASNPISVLGFTKRIAEKICENFNSTKKDNLINIVRFGNVFGSSGSAISNFLEKINSNQKIHLTDKRATRFFMTIFEACHLVLQVAQMKVKNKIFVLNMGKPIKIFDIITKLVKMKSEINPNYNFKYKEIGLRSGEKLHETIFDKSEIKKKFNNDIYLVKSKKKLNKNFNEYLKEINYYFDKNLENKLLKTIKKIKGY